MEIKGDFLGFEFAGVRSEDLGIIRISDGDRYEETLQPEIKDITAEVPGMDGEYYFGSNFGVKNISVSFAFDEVSEEQFRKIRKTFGRKKIGKLIFDERPYKYYMAKIESPIELSFICFDEPKRHIDESGNEEGVRIIEREYDEETGELVSFTREPIYPYVYDGGTQRVYKGEGKIDFVCYFPFAKSVYKVLPVGVDNSDWEESSGMLDENHYTNIVDEYKILNPPAEGEEQEDPIIRGFEIYNCGDLPTGFRLYLPSTTAAAGVSLIYKEDGENTTAELVLNSITMKGTDIGVLIDTNNELIVGVSSFTSSESVSYTTSGNLYNEYINSGYFFKIEPNDSTSDRSILQIDGGSSEEVKIFYDYLYF